MPVPYLSAPALGVAYPTAWPLPLAAQPYLGKPAQPSPSVPQGFPLPLQQYPSAQPMPVQLPQAYPLVAQPLGSPFPAPLPVGAATAYFPASSPVLCPLQPLFPLAVPSSAPQPQPPQNAPAPARSRWLRCPSTALRPKAPQPTAPQPANWYPANADPLQAVPAEEEKKFLGMTKEKRKKVLTIIAIAASAAASGASGAMS
eukprot:EG_transcript_23563